MSGAIILALIIAGFIGLIVWILKHETLRWIFAFVGAVVIFGALARSCGGHARHAAAALDSAAPTFSP